MNRDDGNVGGDGGRNEDNDVDENTGNKQNQNGMMTAGHKLIITVFITLIIVIIITITTRKLYKRGNSTYNSSVFLHN